MKQTNNAGTSLCSYWLATIKGERAWWMGGGLTPQPEPCTAAVVAANLDLNASREPNSSSMAEARGPVGGSPPPFCKSGTTQQRHQVKARA